MDTKLRKAQKQALKAFSKTARDFALTGGTALELYYLHHRFSADLDFFSHGYNTEEIKQIVTGIRNLCKRKVKLELEFVAHTKAKVRFYTISIKNAKRPLKIDFVEDIIFEKPAIKKIDGVRVYGIEHIYMQKLIAITGTHPEIDEIGRGVTSGRREARDIFDMYMLSKNIRPLSAFLRKASPQIQRGIIHWYRTFSRQDCKVALLDLDIYDTKFNARDMIVHLEREVEQFMKEMLA